MTASFLSKLADRIDPPEVSAQEVWRSYGWEAHAKQHDAEAMAARVDELLFGGAAGGGKSEFLLMHLIAEMERSPGNRGVVFRRDMPRLARSLLPRAERVLHGRAKPNANEHTFTFPNGSILEFAHLEREASVNKYQGTEYGVIAFEEVTEFLESQWDALSIRLRAAASGIRPHMLATTNPGGIGHRWVKRRWVKPDPVDVVDGEPLPGVAWSARPHTVGTAPITRCFIPSTVSDNPTLMRNDPGYLDRTLARVSNRAMRQAMAQGDWDAIDQVEGALWQWSWIDENRRPPGWERGHGGGLVRVVVGVDPAATSNASSDETGIIVAALGADGQAYVLADRTCSLSPDGWGRRAVAAYREFGADRIVVERNNGGEMVQHVLATVDPNVPVRTVWASRGKVTRAEPVAALYESGRVHHLGADLAELEEQMTMWVPSTGMSPDRVDALVWALTELMLDSASQPATSSSYQSTALRGTR